jgi:hypothetical protein
VLGIPQGTIDSRVAVIKRNMCSYKQSFASKTLNPQSLYGQFRHTKA